MQAAGLFRVLQPKRWGGYEMDPATYFEIQLALGEGCMSTAWVYGVVGLHPWLMGLFDDRAAQRGVGQGRRDADLLLADAGRQGGAGAGRLPPERALEILQRLRPLRLGLSRRELGGGGRQPSTAASFSCRAATTRSSTPGTSPGLKATGSHDIVVKDAFVPDYRRLRWIDNFNGVGPGQAVNTVAALSLAVRADLLPRRIDRRARRAARACSTRSSTTAACGSRAAARPSDDPVVQLVVRRGGGRRSTR